MATLTLTSLGQSNKSKAGQLGWTLTRKRSAGANVGQHQLLHRLHVGRRRRGADAALGFLHECSFNCVKGRRI